MNSPEEQDQTAHEPIKEGPLRFVTELADKHDYWMSLTDAARITRTSEAMARRWVTSGRLPTKQEPVGINQRTRLVRASDVARIRPIIDPSAAITDDLHKLDLPSIPRQQIQIMQEQTQLSEALQNLQRTIEGHIGETRTALEQSAAQLQLKAQEWDRQLSAQYSTLQHTLDIQHQQHTVLATQVQEQARHIEQYNNELKADRQRYQHDLEQLRTITSNQYQEIHATLQEARQNVQQQLTTLDQDHRKQVEQIQHAFTLHLQQQEEQLQQTLQEIEALLAQHDQRYNQLQHDLAETQRLSLAYQEDCTLQIEQRVQEVKIALNQQLSGLTEENATLHERLAGLERRLEQAITQSEVTSHAYREHTEAQEQRIQALNRALLDEIKARELLSAQLAAQKVTASETSI